MSIYKISPKYKAGKFKLNEIEIGASDCWALDYNDEYQMISYDVPLYGGAASLYTVSRELMPEELTAMYDSNGDIERVELSGIRLIYIYYKNVIVPERVILKFIKAEADKFFDMIIKRKQMLARIFIEKFYDGEAVDIAAKAATAEELQTVINECDGEIMAADNSGNFLMENRMAIDCEKLGVMLMCADGFLRNRLFEKVAETFAERI